MTTDAAIAQAFRELVPTDKGCLYHRELIIARASELDAEMNLAEARKAAQDAYLYGTGFMRDGKHIPVQDVMVNCRHDWATDGMGDYCRYCKKREDSYTPPAQAAEEVERVARAIYANEWAPGSPAWAGLHDVNRIAWRNMARAAIAAMQAGEAGGG